MTSPKLTVAASGFSGRGYSDILGVNGGKPLMGITTALGAMDHPGIRAWERQQVAAFVVTHIEEIAAKDVEVGYRYLQAVPKFLTPEKHDELPLELDLWNAAEVALNDAAEAGNWIHGYVEDYFNDNFPESPAREGHYQMVEAFHSWEAKHDIEVIATERTVYGDRYAGTADAFLKIDGIVTLVDWKSSRKVRDTHKAQLAAIGSSASALREVPEGTPNAIKHVLQPKVSEMHGGQKEAWFVDEPLPDFEAYSVVQIRPGDTGKYGEWIEPFCEMHVIPQKQIDAGWSIFQACRDLRLAQKQMKEAERG